MNAYDLREELSSLLARAEAEAADPRPVYRLLGAARLLAPHWPADLGGRGAGPVEAGRVLEALAAAGVPDTLYVTSVCVVGNLLLHAGSATQREAVLPRLAAGETYASVLFSEPGAGSDLAGITTAAVPGPDGGWRITGTKAWSIGTPYSEYGLCVARTGGASAYDGLTLFLIRLDDPGVTVTPVPGIADDTFHEVRLDGVWAAPDSLVGEPGGAWPLMTRAIGFERTGFDYLGRAARWLVAAGTASGTGLDRLAARRHAVRELAYGLAASEEPAGDARLAEVKLLASELARDVAWWADEHAGPSAVLDAAAREAPGLTMSAGASEVLLEVIAASHEADGWYGAAVDAAARELGTGFRHGFAGVAADARAAWRAVLDMEGFELEVPLALGGLDLGSMAAAALYEELGRAALPPGIALGTAAAVDLLVDDGGSLDAVRRGGVEGWTLDGEPSWTPRRLVRQAAWFAGAAARACEEAIRHVLARRVAGRRLHEYQTVRAELARCGAEARLAQVAVHAAAAAVDRDEASAAAEARGALALAVEAARLATRTAVQLHGARGLTYRTPVATLHELVRAEARRCGPLPALWSAATDRHDRPALPAPTAPIPA